MSVDSYLDLAADQSVTLDGIVDAYRDRFGTLYMELMQEPEKRNEGIESDAVNALMENTAVLHGEEYSDVYWEPIVEFLDLSLDEIQDMPIKDNAWATGRALVGVVSYKQAFVESGLAAAILEHAGEAGKVSQSAFSKLTPEEQKKTAVENDKKNRIKEKKKNA